MTYERGGSLRAAGLSAHSHLPSPIQPPCQPVFVGQACTGKATRFSQHPLLGVGVGVGEGGRAKRQGVQETKRKQRCYGSETRLRLTCWALSPYPPLNEARAENVKQQHADGAERCLLTAPVVPAGGVRGGRGRTKTAVGILAPPHYNNLRGRQALLKPFGLHRLGGDVVSVKVVAELLRVGLQIPEHHQS